MRKTRSMQRHCFFLAFFFIFLGQTPVWSQENEKPREMKAAPPARAMVIASRLQNVKKDIREVPSNVTYIGEEDLELAQPLRFQDAVEEIEGATFFDSVGNGWDSSFGLRGFSGSNSIVFLVDGVRVNEVDGSAMNFHLIPMNDVESIQVERGSASPVYGSNAFAGVVNVTTGQPSDKPVKAFGSLEGSSFGGLNFNQGLSGTLEDRVTPLGGKFKYYFNGGRDVGDGWRENSEWRITQFDVKTAYELAEEQGRFYVNVKHVDDAISNPGELTFQQAQDRMEQTNKPLDGRDLRNTVIQIGGDKKFWDDHLTASVMNSWRPLLLHFFSTSGTFTDPPFNPDTDLITVKSNDQNLITQLRYEDYWREELFNETLIGMEFRDESLHSVEQDAFGGNVVESSPRETERGVSAYNTALFWRETLKFYDKIIPYVGMRHDFNWLETHDFLTPSDSLSRRWRESTVSAGLTVRPVPFADLFVNYSEGFRVPAISDVTPFGGTVSTSVNPETSKSYETGTRLRYKEVAAYKTSFFLIDLEDEIVFDSTAIGPTAPFGQNINISKSRRVGLEQRVDLNPAKEIRLFASHTWMRSYVRETGPGGTPFDDRSLGQIPENRFTLGTTLTPLARFGEPYDGLKMRFGGVFTGRQHPQSFESASQATLNATGGAGHYIKPFAVFNFLISYEWKEKMIYFKINNLFDEKYYSRAVNATSFGTALYPFGTYTFVNPGAPREFVLGTKWEF
ncbi:MAG: TonB-dependent receptor [Candidatus Omnitrophica bacterium]|nr:TonB-dependent receptor [Candidatus Omnitrophota bacterium]